MDNQQHKAAPASADNPSAAIDELHIGVSNNDQGVHINIMQRHADGSATVIYAAKAPAGDSHGRARLAAPVAQSTAGADEPERLSTDESREYLVKFHEQHFTDKTFHRYIRGAQGDRSKLAGDFAWQMARALRLLAAPAAQAPSPWQPIEAAPKDGRTLLLGCFNSRGHWRTMRGQWYSSAAIADEWEDPDGAEEGWYETAVEPDVPNCWSINPTHWMPLPAAPEQSALGEKGGDGA